MLQFRFLSLILYFFKIKKLINQLCVCVCAHSMMILLNWNGCRNSRRSRFPVRIYRSCSWYPVPECKRTPHRKHESRTRVCSTRKYQFGARRGVSGVVGPHAIGPLDWSSSLRTTPCLRSLLIQTPVRRWPRGGGMWATAAARAGNVCIAQRTKRHSGEPVPWARKHFAMHAAWGTSPAGWCRSTGPPQAQLLCWQNTRTLTGKCWSCDGRRKWWGSSSSSCSICNISRTWCSMFHPTVRITWSTSNGLPLHTPHLISC